MWHFYPNIYWKGDQAQIQLNVFEICSCSGQRQLEEYSV